MKIFFEHLNGFFTDLFKKEEFWFIVFALGIGGAFLASIPTISTREIIPLIGELVMRTLSLWIFLFLFPFFKLVWLFWKQEQFKRKEEWVMVEICIPRELKKNPRAMEQVLAALHALRNSPGNFKESYLEGQVTKWFSFELVSIGGEIHLYVRVPKKYKDYVEASLFSYYEDIEIREVEDYIAPLPHSCRELIEREVEFWGTEMILAKEDAYPIKTYPNFEHEAEEKQYDPIATFLETLGRTKKEEIAGFHMITVPADVKWKDQWKELLEKIQKPIAPKGDDKKAGQLTPGQVEVLKAVEMNLSKPAFHTLIRIFYFAPKTAFNDGYTKGLTGAFQQYTALNLNAFKGNSAVAPKAGAWSKPYVFPGLRGYHRKERLIAMLTRRDIPPESLVGRILLSSFFSWYTKSKLFVMNIEGLATVFHPPTKVILTSPHLRQVHSKKTSPPIGLAIYGEENEIEHYK